MKASIRRFRFLVVGLAVLYMSLAFVAIASAAWRMEIESKTVLTNQTGVTLNFTYTWDVKMLSASLPVIVRSITPGSFWTGTLPYDTTNFDEGINDSVGVTWHSSVPPWAGFIREVRPHTIDAEVCGEGDASPYDGISPDRFEISAQGGSALAAKPDGIVFVTLRFNVTNVPGQFEFDTACFSPTALTKVFMIDGTTNSVDHGPPPGTNDAVFNKGVVTLRENSPGNDRPNLNWINPPPHVNVGDSLKFGVSAFDPDGTTPVLTALNLPNHATFNDTGHGAGVFSFIQPDIAQKGAHWVRFVASDGILADTSDWVGFVVVDPLVGILTEETNVPTVYSLSQNYPNPFNANTLIQFSLAETGPVKLEIFNILGRKIATPVDGVISPGTYTVSWNGKDTDGKSVSSGIYFYRLTTGTFTQVKKMVLMK